MCRLVLARSFVLINMEEDSPATADAGHLSANQKIFRLCSNVMYQQSEA